MMRTETIGGRECTLYWTEGARMLMIQPVDAHDRSLLDREVEAIGSLTDKPFCLAAFAVGDWQAELTPWPAPPAFGKKPFGAGADATLEYVESQLLPPLRERWRTTACVLGGYSLAGLFALWAGYHSGSFDGIAAASPSVWYPQWTDRIAEWKMHSKAVYLSLGDKESHTKNPVMSKVDEAIRVQHRLLEAQPVATTLEWNAGNHFAEPELRMAKAFAWAADIAGQKPAAL